MIQKKTEQINIPAPQIKILKVKIEGTSPLIFHRWNEKSKKQMLEKQMKTAASNKAKEARDPFAEYQSSFYKDAKGFIAFPALNIKQAIVDSARNVDGLHMTLLRGSVFVKGDMDEMIQVLHKGKPLKVSAKTKKLDGDDKPEGLFAVDSKSPEIIQMREDMVRIGNGSTDLRYRGQVKQWEMDFYIKYNEGILKADQVLNLLQISGFACGLGEWRPQRSGGFGTFEIAK